MLSDTDIFARLNQVGDNAKKLSRDAGELVNELDAIISKLDDNDPFMPSVATRAAFEAGKEHAFSVTADTLYILAGELFEDDDDANLMQAAEELGLTL